MCSHLTVWLLHKRREIFGSKQGFVFGPQCWRVIHTRKVEGDTQLKLRRDAYLMFGQHDEGQTVYEDKRLSSCCRYSFITDRIVAFVPVSVHSLQGWTTATPQDIRAREV